MELTQNFFKKVIILTFLCNIFYGIFESLPFFSNYQSLEDQLHQGYFSKFISFELSFIILVFLLIINLIGLFLLYRFNKLGRPVYSLSYILILLFIMFDGDWIQYGFSYPFDIISSFLEVFILYLIYLTPLKNEFENN